MTVVPFAGLPVTFARGELDSKFGNHQAYLVLQQDGRTPLLAPDRRGPFRRPATETRPTPRPARRSTRSWRPPTFPRGSSVGSPAWGRTATSRRSPAEAHVGGRPLLISTIEDGRALVQPRLVTDGDVKGGRWDSDLVDLVVGHPSYLGALGSGPPLPW